MMQMRLCAVYRKPVAFGSRVHPGECATKWTAYKKPRPEHERVERDHASGQFAQSDRYTTPDEPYTRSKPA